MSHGTVKFFNAAKGFGFITPDDGSKDVFVAAASVSSSGIGTLKPGQRVSFEVKPDARGPMAVSLVLLAEPPRQIPPKNGVVQNRTVEESRSLTFYFDAADDNAQSALEDLRAAGHDPKPVDYVATPPRREELKALSMLLSNKNQNLVKTYAPLFYDLRLNDRFLSQNEYWDAIVEHPSLINGPIVSTPTDANLYNAKGGVEAFLRANFPNVTPVDRRQTKAIELPEEEPAPAIEEEDEAFEDDDLTAEPENSVKKLAGKKAKASAASKAKSPAKPKVAAKKLAAKPATKAKLKTAKK